MNPVATGSQNLANHSPADDPRIRARSGVLIVPVRVPNDVVGPVVGTSAPSTV